MRSIIISVHNMKIFYHRYSSPLRVPHHSFQCATVFKWLKHFAVGAWLIRIRRAFSQSAYPVDKQAPIWSVTLRYCHVTSLPKSRPIFVRSNDFNISPIYYRFDVSLSKDTINNTWTMIHYVIIEIRIWFRKKGYFSTTTWSLLTKRNLI